MNLPSIDVPTHKQLASYFENAGLQTLVEASKAPPKGVNELITESPYRPELGDLFRLHRLVIDTRRTTVLEFGVGWSTLVFAHALAQNKQTYAREVAGLRRNNPFQLFSVDDEPNFAEIAKARVPSALQDILHLHISPVRMTSFGGRYATEYESLPLMNPDLIYLDGPDQFGVINELGGISTAHKDMMTMSCDILKFEHFLTPGTIIVVDGRAANTRFLRCNFQRNWTYQYDSNADQHMFLLNEPPLGKHSRRQLQFYGFEDVQDE